MIAIIPDTTLLICSRNRAKLLLDTIHSVLVGDTLPAEILVIDQSDRLNSAISAINTSAGCEIHVIWKHAHGLSKARNTGLQEARHEIITIIDDDMFVEKDWFRAIVDLLVRSRPMTAITGRVTADKASGSAGFSPSLVEDDKFAEFREVTTADVLASGNMACIRSEMLAVGGFDERLGPGTIFPAAEDSDLGFRLLTNGYRILYTPEATVIHRAWRTQNQFLSHRWDYGLGRGAFYAKQSKHRIIRQRLQKDVINHFLKGITTLRVDRLNALGNLYLAGGIIVGAILWWRKYPQN